MKLLDIAIDEKVMADIMKYLFSTEKKIEDLYKLLISHPAFIYKLFILANSEEFGFHNKITDVISAMAVLEIDTIENLLIDNSVIQLDDREIKAEYDKILSELNNNLKNAKEKKDYNLIIYNLVAAGCIYPLTKYKKNYFGLATEKKMNTLIKNLEENRISQEVIKDVSRLFKLYFEK